MCVHACVCMKKCFNYTGGFAVMYVTMLNMTECAYESVRDMFFL